MARRRRRTYFSPFRRTRRKCYRFGCFLGDIDAFYGLFFGDFRRFFRRFFVTRPMWKYIGGRSRWW